jgi:hypothetical protein
VAETDDTIKGWFAGRIPGGWFTAPPEVTDDREEILIVGTLPDVELGADASEETRSAARSGRIRQHREDTREARMRVAGEAQHQFRRKVARPPGARHPCGRRGGPKPEPRACLVRALGGNKAGRMDRGAQAGPLARGEGSRVRAGRRLATPEQTAPHRNPSPIGRTSSRLGPLVGS